MKIKAFTLLEMLMVLALTGLVLAISWGVYSNFYLFSREYDKRNELNTELALLDETLRRDCEKSEEIRGDSLEILLDGQAPVVYRVFEEGIVRGDGANQDSFWLRPPVFRIDSTNWEFRLGLTWSSKSQTYRVHRPSIARNRR